MVPLSQSLVFLNLLTSSCSSGTKGRISSTRRTVLTAAGWSWSKSRAQPAAGSGWAVCSPELCPSSSVSRGGCSAQSAWLCARWVPKLLAELAGLQCPSVPSALVTAFLVTKCFPGAPSVGVGGFGCRCSRSHPAPASICHTSCRRPLPLPALPEVLPVRESPLHTPLEHSAGNCASTRAALLSSSIPAQNGQKSHKHLPLVCVPSSLPLPWSDLQAGRIPVKLLQ